MFTLGGRNGRYSVPKCIIMFLLAISLTIYGNGTEDPAQQVQSVGKVRSSAELAFSKGDIDGAVKLWTKVISMEPGNDSNFFKRFRVYLRQSKLKEALADLNAVLQLKPNNEAALVQKGKLEMRLGRCADAYSSMKKLQRYVQFGITVFCFCLFSTSFDTVSYTNELITSTKLVSILAIKISRR